MTPSDVGVYVAMGDEDVLAGRLYSHRRRGVESASFSYDEQYLGRKVSYALDPNLPLLSGTQQTPVGLPLFRAFADSLPDRWGRTLITRAERMRARSDGRTPRSFGAFDLLLGVRDDLRQGAVRFGRIGRGGFLAADVVGVPLVTDLPSLLSAADRVGTGSEDADTLQLLLQTGSSLGGARPKAHLRDQNGLLAIAKFPSPADAWNVMAWEKTALDLAEHAGIRVPPSHLITVTDRSVLIVDRFDRGADGSRIGYVSAMTMVEAQGGDTGSYLDIAATIEVSSPSTSADLEQLWRRMALSILISNTDDHLRNHGFLHVEGDSWTLSPAFDLNPNPQPGVKHLSTAIDDGDTRASISTLMRVAPLFRLGPEGALRILGEVLAAAGQWRTIAGSHGLARSAQTDMALAFDHPESAAARQLVSG